MGSLTFDLTRTLLHMGVKGRLHARRPSAKRCAGLMNMSRCPQVPKLLGGVRVNRNLRLICLEEPGVFSVQSQVRPCVGRGERALHACMAGVCS